MQPSIEPVRYRTDEGVYVALLVLRGTKYLHLIPMDSGGIKIIKVPLTEERYMKLLTKGANTYPLKRARKLFKRAGEVFGISEDAKKALRRGLS